MVPNFDRPTTARYARSIYCGSTVKHARQNIENDCHQ